MLADTATDLENRLRSKCVPYIYEFFDEACIEPATLDHESTAVPVLRDFVQHAYDTGLLSLRNVKAALQGLAEQKLHLTGQLRAVYRLVTS